MFLNANSSLCVFMGQLDVRNNSETAWRTYMWSDQRCLLSSTRLLGPCLLHARPCTISKHKKYMSDWDLWCQGRCKERQTAGVEPLVSWGLVLFWSPGPNPPEELSGRLSSSTSTVYVSNLPFPWSTMLTSDIFQVRWSCKGYYKER